MVDTIQLLFQSSIYPILNNGPVSVNQFINATTFIGRTYWFKDRFVTFVINTITKWEIDAVIFSSTSTHVLKESNYNNMMVHLASILLFIPPHFPKAFFLFFPFSLFRSPVHSYHNLYFCLSPL